MISLPGEKRARSFNGREKSLYVLPGYLCQLAHPGTHILESGSVENISRDGEVRDGVKCRKPGRVQKHVKGFRTCECAGDCSAPSGDYAANSQIASQVRNVFDLEILEKPGRTAAFYCRTALRFNLRRKLLVSSLDEFGRANGILGGIKVDQIANGFSHPPITCWVKRRVGELAKDCQTFKPRQPNIL